MATIKERIRGISEKLSYNQGYLGPGKARWGYHARKHVMAKNGKIRLDEMSSFIQRGVSRDRLIALLKNKSSRMGLIYSVSNPQDEDGYETPQEAIIGEYHITEEEAECICEVLDRVELDYLAAIDILENTDTEDVYVGRIKMTAEMFEFAKIYAYSRICGANTALQDTKLLRATCNKIEEIDSDIVDDAKRKQMKAELMKFLVKTTDMRKGVVSTTLLNYECSKIFFRWGIIVHRNYTEWTEEAIAMAILWSKAPSVARCGHEMANLLFPLSCHELQPEELIVPVVEKFEELIEAVEEYGVAPSTAMAYEFLQLEHHDEAFMFKTLLRLSTSVGRRYKKWQNKRKRKTG